MCPEFERHEREYQNTLDRLEKVGIKGLSSDMDHPAPSSLRLISSMLPKDPWDRTG